VKRKLSITELIKTLKGYPKNLGELRDLLQAVSDGRVDIDSQIKSFLAENCRALRILSGDIGIIDYPSDITEIAFSLILYKDDQEFAVIDYPIKEGRFEIGHISPALYSLKSSTGLLLWQKNLGKQELLIGKSAKEEGKLRMAADSGQDKPVASVTEELANGVMRLNVYAGFDSGRIEIIYNSKGDS